MISATKYFYDKSYSKNHPGGLTTNLVMSRKSAYFKQHEKKIPHHKEDILISVVDERYSF